MIYSLSHLTDGALLRDLATLIAQERSTTAALLAHIAEVDARKLYMRAAYPSMFAWCVHELRLSEDSAYKRIQAARTARQYPVIFDALADGRLHLSAVSLLAPHLTPGNAPGLLEAAAHKTKAEIEQLIARRFPRSEMLPMVEVIPATSRASDDQLAPAQVDARTPEGSQLAPAQVEDATWRPRIAPTASDRFALHVTIGQGVHDKLRYAQALLSHQIPSGDIAAVIERALDSLIRETEKRKFAATDRPQRKARKSTSQRHIPAGVKRAVWERDQGQCTFVSDAGRRCAAHTRLEFDHIEEVARGGQATVAGIRLRCRAHNQFTAECTFGSEFMNKKREEAQRVAKLRAAAKACAEARQRAEAAAAAERAREQDVVPWLRRLGFRADEARRAAKSCEAIPDAPLEERVRVALSGATPC